jgi:hypothetical protein
MRYDRTVTESATPSGCHVYYTSVYLNLHAVGARDETSRLLCDASTAAPTSPGFTYPPTGADFLLLASVRAPACCMHGWMPWECAGACVCAHAC